MPYMLLKNLVANKISINTANNDRKDFVFNLMKGYNITSFFSVKKDIKNLSEENMYQKADLKALEILLECEKSVAGIKKFLPKIFKKDIREDQKKYFIKFNKVIRYQKYNC